MFLVGLLFIAPSALILVVAVHVVKFFHSIRLRDPFHNSRQHPLNSPNAPRG